jgi:lipopolysaccharide transport system ATP-binding protein
VTPPAVEFIGVSKKFRRGERHDSLRDLVPDTLARWLGRGSHEPLGKAEFWALRDVSFSVGPGEALGIIGANGAGKSTALKLLTRILRPTEGHCRVRGRIGALIEVAAGFHPDLTGRENVYLQGAIMGMRRAEIDRKFDEIVAFSGIAEFIDTPVKRYSSGMNARLGFAVAAHLDPDVLLIDEVLSVGDVAFQERCLTRMRTLLRRGLPLVFVSHNLTAVTGLCTRALVLDHGRVAFDGPPAEAVREYRRLGQEQTPDDAEGQAHGAPIRIAGVEISSGGVPTVTLGSGADLRVRIFYRALEPTRVHAAVDIHSADGVYCAGINTQMDGRDLGELTASGCIDLVIPRLWLLPGCYLLTVGLLDQATLQPFDVQHRAHPISVVSLKKDFGLVYLERSWEHRPAQSAHAGLPSPRRIAHARVAHERIEEVSRP